MCMCMRASGASELRKLWHFYILKLLFLSIFCRYIRYFVGTDDMLVGLHVRQISKCTDNSPKRHYWGGGGQSGYANADGVVLGYPIQGGSVKAEWHAILPMMCEYENWYQ